MTASLERLPRAEWTRFNVLEQTIRGQTTRDPISLLREIRDKRFYRFKWLTFEAYLRDRFGPVFPDQVPEWLAQLCPDAAKPEPELRGEGEVDVASTTTRASCLETPSDSEADVIPEGDHPEPGPVGLGPEFALAARINAEHAAAIEAAGSAVGHAIEAGRLLIEAKSIVPHGSWTAWVEMHCRFSLRMAQHYMRVAKNETRFVFDGHPESLRRAVAMIAGPTEDDDEPSEPEPEPEPKCSVPVVDLEFHHVLPPLTEEERDALEASLVADGCLYALTVWDGVLVDGHYRLEICLRRGIPFQVREQEFESREHAKEFIIRNQLGRKNLSPEERCQIVRKLESLRTK